MSDELHVPWPEVRLGDHARVKARLGWKGLKAEEYVLDGPIFLAAPNLRGGRIDFDRVDHLPQWRYDESPEIQLAVGDVLLVKDGSTLGMSGIVNALPAPTTVNGSIAVIRPDASLASGYLFYSINGQRFQRLIWLRRAGLGVPHLFQADLREFKIPLPSPAEQSRIAEILSTLDETIDQTEALIAKYQQIKAGMMQDLFTRGVTPDGRLRPFRFEAPHLYKDSPLGWIPKEWDVARLFDRRCSGKPHLKTGPFGSSLKGEHWVSEGRPVITIGALGEGKLIDSELLFVSERTAAHLCEYQLDAGDVVFSRVADVGRSAMILPVQKGWIMSSNLMRISLDPNSVRPAYLQAQLANDMRIRTQIRRTVNSSGRDVANSQILNRILFAWPRPEEQDRVLLRVQALDELIDVQRLIVTKHQSTRLGLMHELLTGRVRVRVADSEAVSA